MQRESWRWAAALCCLMAWGVMGCSDDGEGPGPTGDKGIDGLVVDGGPLPEATVDGPPAEATLDGPPAEATVDGPPAEATVDGPPAEATVDGPPAEATVDGPPVEGGTTGDGTGEGTTPPAEKVIYSVNSSSTKYTFNEVKVDGTGQQVISGLPPDLEICDIDLAGPNGPVDVTRNVPVTVPYGGESYIHLPFGPAKLVRWYDGSNYGLTVVGATGTFSNIMTQGAIAATGDTCTSDYFVQVSADGKLAAAVVDGTKIYLLKLDGTTWSGTTPASPALDVTPTVAPKDVIDNSLTMGKSTLLFVGNDAASKNFLYAVPLSGSAAATAVTLPNVSGAAPDYINWYMTVNDGGDVFALTAGTTSSNEMVFTYKDGTTPTIATVSATVDDYYYSGTEFMDGLNPRLAVSPTGTYVAFATSSTSMTMHVATVDGTTLQNLQNQFTQTGSSSTIVDTFGAFYWVDDDNLLFWAGTSTTSAGLYHYKVSTKVLVNLAGSSLISAPWDGGNLYLDGGWVEPGGKYLYLLVGISSSTRNLWAVDLALPTTNTVKALTTSLDIYAGGYADDFMEGLQGSNYVWFAAKLASNSTSPYFYDLFVFDQSTAGTALQITSTPTTGTSSVYLTGLTPSPDGAHVAYVTSSNNSSTTAGQGTLYVAPTAGTSSPVALTTAGAFVEATSAWTSDSSKVVFGSGATSAALNLQIIPVSGGTATTLHSAQSHLFVVGVFK